MRGVLAVTGKTEATSEPGCRSVLRLLWSRWSKSLLTMMTLRWCLLPQHGTFCASLCRLSAVSFAVRDYVIVIRLYLYLHCQLYSFILVFFFGLEYCVSLLDVILLRRCRFGAFVCARALYSVWRIKRQLTGQLADKPTRGQSSRGLDNSRTGQLADSEFLKIME